jgi:hypothetical protein
MKSQRRMVSTLLINIFVSALVTGTVIFFYDRAQRADCNTTPPIVGTLPTGNADINISIAGIIGVRNLQDERLVIQNNSTLEIELTGWTLSDNKSPGYVFPQIMLFPGAKLQVHTTTGKDTPTDLYWGRAAPVWTSGELVALYDTHNIVRAFYRVP